MYLRACNLHTLIKLISNTKILRCKSIKEFVFLNLQIMFVEENISKYVKFERHIVVGINF